MTGRERLSMASAVIVAAGRGKRMRTPVAKQFLEISGKPVLARTLEVFACHPRISRIQLVVSPDDMEFCETWILREFGKHTDIRMTAGGTRRQDSVYRGLLALGETNETVLVHDGVRPFVTPGLISDCIDGAAETGACIAAIPASDTLKQVDSDNMITETLARDRIWLAQTPQAFSYSLIKNAFDKAAAEGFSGTDEASIVERTGRAVRIVEGSRLNIKITAPGDLEIAERLFEIFKSSAENPEVSDT